jgi:hypothetical protein
MELKAHLLQTMTAGALAMQMPRSIRRHFAPSVFALHHGYKSCPKKHVCLKILHLDGVNDLGELIHSLPSVVCVHVGILGAEMPPLKAVDRSQIALFSAKIQTRISSSVYVVKWKSSIDVCLNVHVLCCQRYVKVSKDT